MLGSGPVPVVYNGGAERRGQTVVYDAQQKNNSVRVVALGSGAGRSSDHGRGRGSRPPGRRSAGQGAGQVFAGTGSRGMSEGQRSGVPAGRTRSAIRRRRGLGTSASSRRVHRTPRQRTDRRAHGQSHGQRRRIRSCRRLSVSVGRRWNDYHHS